jgi:arginine/lysine/histidine transporter system substrate-binding protein
MNHRPLSGVICASGLVAMVLVTGCGTATQAGAATSSHSGQSKQLVMATGASFPPFEYHDTTGGTDKIVGFDVDVANQIAKSLGFTFTISDMPFSSIIGALDDKRADFSLADITPTPARAKNVDFSTIYFEDKDAIIEKKGSNIKSLNDLKGKTIGVSFGTTQEQEAKKVKGATVSALDGSPAVIEAIQTGRVDAGIEDATVAVSFLKKNPDLEMHVLPASADNGAAVAFPKGSKWVAPFNKELKKMKADGELDKLEVKWFGSSFVQK